MSDKFIIPENQIIEVKGRGIPKPANDQNTDDILPGRFLREITFARMGDYVYFNERFKDGKPVEDHPFNDPRYDGANILIGGANYGCGSSREHAPQGLHRFGINAIIAESFAEIFAGNCASLGVAGVTVSAKDVTSLADYVQKNPQTELSIDLSEKLIRYDSHAVSFDMPEGTRQSFLNGTWDAMTVLQQNEAGVKGITQKLDYLNF